MESQDQGSLFHSRMSLEGHGKVQGKGSSLQVADKYELGCLLCLFLGTTLVPEVTFCGDVCGIGIIIIIKMSGWYSRESRELEKVDESLGP